RKAQVLDVSLLKAPALRIMISMRTAWWAGLVSIVLAISVTGCSSSSKKACEGKPGVKLAYFGVTAGGESGPFSGAQLAVDQFVGQSPTCRVELFAPTGIPDTTSEDTKARAREVSQDPSVIGVVGPATSSDALVVDKIFSDAGLTMISPTANLAT